MGLGKVHAVEIRLPRRRVRRVAGRIRLLGCSAAALAATVPALAAAAPGSAPSAPAAPRIPDWSGSRYGANSFDARFYDGLAQCLAARWPGRAQAILATLPDSPPQRAAVTSLLADGGQCVFWGRVKLKVHRLRGALAEALLRQGHVLPQGAPWLVGNETSGTFGRALLAAYSGRALDQEERSDLLGRRVAYCTVQKDAALVEDLLRKPPSSRQEPSALGRLDPTLSACLPAGLPLNIGLSSMRAYLAEALYWRRSLEGSPDAQS